MAILKDVVYDEAPGDGQGSTGGSGGGNDNTITPSMIRHKGGGSGGRKAKPGRKTKAGPKAKSARPQRRKS